MDRPLMAVAGHQGEHQITTPMVEQARESPQVRENPRYRIMVAVEVSPAGAAVVGGAATAGEEAPPGLWGERKSWVGREGQTY